MGGVGAVMQRPALVNTGNVRYWAATFYDQLAANLCSAVWRGPGSGDVTNGDTCPDRCQQSSPPPIHHLKLQLDRDTTQAEEQILVQTYNWLALQRHCWLYCGPDGGEHHNCVRLTVTTMPYRCEMTSDLTEQNVVKLREREGQRVDLGWSLKGHL